MPDAAPGMVGIDGKGSERGGAAKNGQNRWGRKGKG